MTKIRLVKTTLKILAVLVSVALLGLGAMYFLSPRDERVTFETLTIEGMVVSKTFVDLRDRISRSEAVKKTFVVKNSGGGDGASSLAIAILLHRHNWDVEVVDICASACAIYIFPAGKTKYLNRHSMLLFHGGPYQANLMENAEKFDQESKMNGAPVQSVTLGQADKEGTFTFNPNRSKADEEVLEFLSITLDSTAVERVTALRRASDQFYQELGVNPLLATYGQIGEHEAKYKAYGSWGFIYRLDSLRKLGIGNIELKDGEWHPERHPAYPDVYEVTYP